MYAHARKALENISSALKRKYPETVTAVIAFGSRVRGDHDEESDFDVLVIVKENSTRISEDIIGIFTEEEMRSNIPFDPVIKTAESFEKEKLHHTPFYTNVTEQGTPV